jgi:hypothetical protein
LAHETKPSLFPQKPSALSRLLHKLSSFLELTWTNLSSLYTNLRLRITPQDDTNPFDHQNDAEKEQTHTQGEDVVHRLEGLPKQHRASDTKNAPKAQQKPTFPVRVLRVLWRRRQWRRMRKTEGGPHWAEIATVCLTVGIFAAACIQAYIYSEQAGIMREQIKQNERAIMLGRGQLEVARNAVSQTENQFREDQRPYVWIEDDKPVGPFGLSAIDGQLSWNFRIKNFGKTPAINVQVQTWIVIGKDAWKTIKWRPFPPNEGSILPPTGENFVTAYPLQKIDPALVDKLASSNWAKIDKTVEIVGKIIYADSRRGDFESDFCFDRQPSPNVYGHCGHATNIK